MRHPGAVSDGELRRRESAAAWELRGALAAVREIVVAWPGGRVRGYVEHVSPTDAFALVWDGRSTIHVPLTLGPSVRRPHFHEDDVSEAVAPPARRVRRPMSGQLAFVLDDPRAC